MAKLNFVFGIKRLKGHRQIFFKTTKPSVPESAYCLETPNA